MNSRWIAALALSMIVATHQASAQDAGRLGVTFAVPTALGVIWHATDNMALRPELNFVTSSSTSTSSGFPGAGRTTIDGRAWELALSAPFYMTRDENVRTYLSPRVGYTHLSNDVDFGGSTSHASNTEMEYSGSVGVQYAPVRRFNIFGETGLSYRTSDNSGTGVGDSSHSWSLRSTVGVILYIGR